MVDKLLKVHTCCVIVHCALQCAKLLKRKKKSMSKKQCHQIVYHLHGFNGTFEVKHPVRIIASLFYKYGLIGPENSNQRQGGPNSMKGP